MCIEEGVNLQRGMNFHLGVNYSVILMSEQPGAPYRDKTEDDGKTIIYEGHDSPNKKDGPDPKTIDQPMFNPSGTLSQNGLFFEAAKSYKNDGKTEIVKVYEKIRPGIWIFNGLYRLVDSWLEVINSRKVFKYKLNLIEDQNNLEEDETIYLDNPRTIPSSVKREVWKRDEGKCVICGNNENLHFDHIIPYSKGGTSLDSRNIQLLCAKHNLQKSDNIE